MTAVRKQFNRALYEAYDTPARDKLVAYLEAKGHTIVSNEENYNVDVVSQKGGFTYFNEAEVKTAWKADWPTDWKEIRIPERKQRLLDKHKDVKWRLELLRLVAGYVTGMAYQRHATHKGKSQRGQGSLHPGKGEQFFHILCPYTSAELIKL